MKEKAMADYAGNLLESEVHIRIDKEPGTDEMEVTYDFGDDPAIGLYAITVLVELLAKMVNQPVFHILAKMATVMLAPMEEGENYAEAD